MANAISNFPQYLPEAQSRMAQEIRIIDENDR